MCVLIIYYQKFGINVGSLRFLLFLIFQFEKEKDKDDIFDTAKAIENCYSFLHLNHLNGY